MTQKQYYSLLISQNQTQLSLLQQDDEILGLMAKTVALEAINLIDNVSAKNQDSDTEAHSYQSAKDLEALFL